MVTQHPSTHATQIHPAPQLLALHRYDGGSGLNVSRCSGGFSTSSCFGRFHLLQILRETIEEQPNRAPRPNWQATPANTKAKASSVAGWTGYGRQPALVEHRRLFQRAAGPSIRRCSIGSKRCNLATMTSSRFFRKTRFSRHTATKWTNLDALSECNASRR